LISSGLLTNSKFRRVEALFLSQFLRRELTLKASKFHELAMPAKPLGCRHIEKRTNQGKIDFPRLIRRRKSRKLCRP
jgi:hypothetical protein